MRLTRSVRAGIYAVVLVAGTLLVARPGSADVGVTKIHVGGAQVLDIETSREDGAVVIAGTLRDDTSAALGGGTVHLAVSREGAPEDPETRDAVRDAVPCVADAKPIRVGADGTLELVSNDSGRFCARLRLLTDRYRVRAMSGALRDLDRAAAEVQLDLARLAMHLSFDPKPRVLDLGADRHTIDVVAIAEDGRTAKPASGKRLSLVSEDGTPLGSGVTNASGRLRFDVANEAMGAPGRGELRVHFGGDESLAEARAVVLVERHVRVDMEISGALEPANPEDGLPLEFAVFGTRGRSRGAPERVVVPSGSLELRAGGIAVGAAPVLEGKVRVVATFADPGFSPVELSARYTPAAPWFEPGREGHVLAPVHGPSPLRRAPLGLAGLLVVLYLVFSRWPLRVRRPRAVDSDAERAAGVRRMAPGVLVVREPDEKHGASAGYSGTVLDAHDGAPISGVLVTLERPSFANREVLVRVATDKRGKFALAFVPQRPGDILRIEGALHVDHEQAAPPVGELQVALVSRRRALLARLVRWAKRRGPPLDHRPEPTPAHVAKASVAQPEIARWANATERAVFGPEPVDRAREGEVSRLAPDDAQND